MHSTALKWFLIALLCPGNMWAKSAPDIVSKGLFPASKERSDTTLPALNDSFKIFNDADTAVAPPQLDQALHPHQQGVLSNMPAGGLREQMLTVAKKRKLSPHLKAEFLKVFGKDLPEELKQALEDPAFTALLPAVRAAKSSIPVTKPAVKVTKDSALKPIQSLSDAWAAAYCFNPELESARKKINLAVNQLSRAFSAMRPQIYLNMDHNQNGSLDTQNGNNPRTVDSDGVPTTQAQYHQREWANKMGVSAKQTLFAGGGIIARIMKAKAEFFASCWSYVVAEQNILLKVSEAYLDYLLADDLLQMEEINAASLDMLFKASNAALSAGIEKPGDRSIAAGQALMQGASKVVEAQRNRNTMLVKLQSLIGAPVEVLKCLVMPTQFTDLPKDVKSLKAKILSDNPSIKASLFTLAGKKHEVVAMQAEFLPKIELEGSVDRKVFNQQRKASPYFYSNQFKEGNSSAQFGVGLRVPIYDRGLMHANLRTSEQEVKLARLELEQNKRTVLWEGVQQWNTLYTSIVNQSLAFRGMLFYTQALMNAQKEYDVGALNIIDFSRVQENWISACRTWITQRFAVVKSSIAVASFLGKVTAQKLKLPVALFNPKKYYEEYATRWTGIGADESENALFELDPLERKE